MSVTRPYRVPRRHFLAIPVAAAAATAASGRLAAAGESAARAGVMQGAGSVRRFTHPGFLDLQVNGFAGVDFNDPATRPDQVREAVAAMRARGVTQLLPTLISAPAPSFERCATTLLQANERAILGIHLEGPYISPEDGARGAHAREHTAPASIDDFKRRQDAAGGRIRLVTLAPEVPGGLRLIEHLRAGGIRAAIGHTAATPEQIREAVRAGASLSTHLGNGCANMLPRHPNFIWEQLAADELIASLIVDGHHLPPATVKAMVRAKTVGRVVLVTDAIAAAGQPPGEYRLGGLRVRLDENGRVAAPGQPNLAGSALSMDRAVANTVRFAGVSIEEALAMASTTPAEYLGVQPAGSLDLEWDPASFSLRVLRAKL
ncbi:MAG TPA: amidohydrolase family protein [Vicinamibacterales bacterium]|nr:amidohydrolase family protein [Vicinamibacterales bacterium]